MSELQDKPVTLSNQIWLVDYECRTTAIVIAPKNNGFFAFGQDALWGFSNVTAWHRCVYCPWWDKTNEQL
jgi:hypothetical protein